MSYQLVVSGHLADPDEEAKIREKCEAFVRELLDDGTHEVTDARFSGSYTGFEYRGGDAPYWERRGYDPLAENAKPAAPTSEPDGGLRAD